MSITAPEDKVPEKITKVRDDRGSVTVPRDIQRMMLGDIVTGGEKVCWYVMDGRVVIEIHDNEE